MSYYSIKDLERLSGIKAHTIRIWEQRYQLLNPTRTDTNIRRYSNDDLRTLLNTSILNKHGFKISKIVDMTEDQLRKQVLSLYDQPKDQGGDIRDLMIVYMLELDEGSFRQMMAKEIDRLGMETCFLKVIYPFLEKIGLLWQIGSINPAQEHFMSNLIRNQLISEIQKLPLPEQFERTYVLFLKENESHEIGLLLVQYILRSRGHQTLYLGANVPYEDLKATLKTVNPTHTFSAYVNAITIPDLAAYLNQIGQDFPKIQHFVGGHQVTKEGVQLPDNMVIASDLANL